MKAHSIAQNNSILRASSRWVCSTCLNAKVVRFEALQQRNTRHHKRDFTNSTPRAHGAAKRDGKLPDYPARTRFAPSPTGIMHIGGLRTALFSYLLAKRTGGQFILRIEDTDQKRYVPGAIERLCEDLQWAGLQWDEGPSIGGSYGPYQQSHRTEIYRKHAEELLDRGAAYRCFCTTQTNASSSYVTSGCYQDCSSLHRDEAHERATTQHFTIRLKSPADAAQHSYPDLVYGNIKRLKRSPGVSVSSDEQDAPDAADTILVKSDGTPTYHFANVVDDHLMHITHVIRGTEWMASTPLHYDLYSAFGWQPPQFAHVGLLLDKDKAKLSKRNADLVLDVRGLQAEDVLPETLCNFLALQGWSNPTRNDVLDMQELISIFDLKFTTGNTMVDLKKLWYLQKHHMERRCAAVKQTGDTSRINDLATKMASIVQDRFPRFGDQHALLDFCTMLLLADDKSFRSAAQFVSRNHYIFSFQKSKVPAPDEEAPVSTLNTLMLAIFTRLETFMESEERRQTRPISKRFRALQKDSTLAHTACENVMWEAILDLGEAGTRLRNTLAKSTETTPVEITPTTEKGADELLKPFQALQRMLMKRLRQVLCCGTPGPGMGMILAILGPTECRRRVSLLMQRLA